MVADKCKKLKASDKVEDQNEEPQFDAALVLSIEKLQEIQDELEKIDEELSEKVLEIEQKYNEVRKPVYGKRNDIIKSIPDFWLIAFLSHPILAQLVSEEDHKVFKYLSSIEVEDFKDVKSGYFISFNFNPNPFFEDSKLTMSVKFLDDGTPEITGTTIKWKEGLDLCDGVANDKKGSKRPHAGDERNAFEALEGENSLQQRTHLVNVFPIRCPLWIKKEEEYLKAMDLPDLDFFHLYQYVLKNFGAYINKEDISNCWLPNPKYYANIFSWFSKTQQEDEVDEIQPEAIADIIKEDLWPNPLTYFTNETDELDFEGEKCDEEEYGNEGSEDEEDEDGGEDEGN